MDPRADRADRLNSRFTPARSVSTRERTALRHHVTSTDVLVTASFGLRSGWLETPMCPRFVITGRPSPGVRTRAPDSTGTLRWLPMLLPVLLFTLAVGHLAWSLAWLSGGLTTGEQVVQRMYLRAAVIAAVLSYAAYRFIRRAHRDPTWRWAAWLCTGSALLTLAMR